MGSSYVIKIILNRNYIGYILVLLFNLFDEFCKSVLAFPKAKYIFLQLVSSKHNYIQTILKDTDWYVSMTKKKKTAQVYVAVNY